MGLAGFGLGQQFLDLGDALERDINRALDLLGECRCFPLGEWLGDFWIAGTDCGGVSHFDVVLLLGFSGSMLAVGRDRFEDCGEIVAVDADAG